MSEELTKIVKTLSEANEKFPDYDVKFDSKEDLGFKLVKKEDYIIRIVKFKISFISIFEGQIGLISEKLTISKEKLTL